MAETFLRGGSVLFVALAFWAMGMSNAHAQQTKTYERGEKILLPAPVGVDDTRLGIGYPVGLSRLDEKRVIPNEVRRISENSYRAVFEKQTNSFQLNASASALNILTAEAGRESQSRHAVLTVYSVSEVASLTASPAAAQGSTADLFVSKIYYGWALNVNISGNATSFTNGIAAELQQLAGAGGSIRNVVERNDLRSEVSLRGLTATSSDVPIALTWQQVTEQFDIGEPQPILIEYTFLRDVSVDPIVWKDRTITPGRYQISEVRVDVANNKADGRRWDMTSTADVKIEMTTQRGDRATFGLPRNLTSGSTRPNRLITVSEGTVIRFTAYDDDSTRENSDPIGNGIIQYDELRRGAPNEPIQVRTNGQLNSLSITLTPVD